VMRLLKLPYTGSSSEERRPFGRNALVVVARSGRGAGGSRQ
jgi:hypothetical protein